MILHGRVAIVTGSGRGAGRGIARQLSRHGATVVINYSASDAGARGLEDEILGSGGQAACVKADVLDQAQVVRMVAQVEEQFSRLDAVVNNAIAGTQGASFEDATWEDYATAYDFGCRAVVNTTRASLPAFRRVQRGRVVNVVTDFWNLAPEGWSVYVAGKGAMVGLSRSLARELGPSNVTVNMVAPGWMIADSADENSDESRRFSKDLPLRKRARPEDIGDVVAFYLSDLASAVTGAYVVVNGGRSPQMGS